MEKKFINLLKTPHLIFWVFIPVIILIGFLGKQKMMVVNVYSSYFVFECFNVSVFISFLLGGLGVLYYIIRKKNIVFNPVQLVIHTVFTILATTVFLIFAILSESNLIDGVTMNHFLLTLALLITVFQLFFVAKFFLQFKKRIKKAEA